MDAIETMTLDRLQHDKNIIRNDKNQWIQYSPNNGSWRFVHNRTIKALLNKNLIIRNGEIYMLTISGKSYSIRKSQRA